MSEREGRERVTPVQLLARMEKFALDVLRVTTPLLGAVETVDLARQLRRAALGVPGNYGAANVARSHADFTSKVGLALEEADESRRWLSLLLQSGLTAGTPLAPLLAEAGELRAILFATHATARRNRGRRKI